MKDDFVRIMETAVEKVLYLIENGLTDPCLSYPDSEKDHQRALDLLAAFCVLRANREKNKEKKRDLFTRATQLYTTADKIAMYDYNHLLGRAYFCLLEGDKVDQADTQFNFVLGQTSSNIPSLLGKACISFNKKEFRQALTFYKKVMRIKANCPADVRLGLGHCYYKMNKIDKAKLAFERALQMDPKCVGALVGLALIELNKKTPDGIRIGVQMLSKAYTYDPTDPMVLNHLANHFFFKKDYQKVQHLALHAFHNTENEGMKAESCYQLARGFHIQGDYDQAFQYYYQATNYSTTSSFVLPYYGLGQMYIHRGDIENATQSFERVLKSHPGNYETMKILGSLYASSTTQVKRDLAKNYLKKVTEQIPDDVEAWIELAQILEQSDLSGALSAYATAMKILKEKVHVEIPPEIYNNVAALHFRLGNLEDAQVNYSASLARCRAESSNDEHYYSSIEITISYNLARLNEALNDTETALKQYKDILKNHPNYIDCYLRLGCIMRDRGQIYDASDFFKEGLQVSQNHPDAWTLIGNLHMGKQEWGPAQKKFERIMKQPSTKEDSYSLLALGNVWLQTLHQPTKDKEKEKRHQERALSLYKQVLRNDNRNIYATNGIGCVLAYKNYIPEARDVFAQVREATADFPDVWLNIAHIYVEQKQYVAAIQMYENCLKKFHKYSNIEILMYLARAYFKNGKLRECKNVLLKARKIQPYDTLILYNLALVLQRLAMQVLEDHKSVLRTVLSAVHELGLAQKYFDYLKTHGDRQKFDPNAAAGEARQCQDLLSQAQYHVARAKRLDEEEKEIKRKQEEERMALQQKVMEEQQQKDEEKKRQEQELIERRRQFVEQSKDKMVFTEIVEDSKSKRKRGRIYEGDEFVNDSSENDAPNRKRRSGDEGAGDHSSSRRKHKKRKHRHAGSGDEDSAVDETGMNEDEKREARRKRKHDRKERERRKRKERSSRREEVDKYSKKNSKYVSREFIDDSGSSDSEEEKLVVDDDKDTSGKDAPSRVKKEEASSDEGSASGQKKTKRRKSSDSSSASSAASSGSDSGDEKRKKHKDKKSRKKRRKAVSDDESSDSDIEIKKKSRRKFEVKRFVRDDDEDDEDSQQKKSSNEGNKSDDEGSDAGTSSKKKQKGSDDSEVERSPSPARSKDGDDDSDAAPKDAGDDESEKEETGNRERETAGDSPARKSGSESEDERRSGPASPTKGSDDEEDVQKSDHEDSD